MTLRRYKLSAAFVGCIIAVAACSSTDEADNSSTTSAPGATTSSVTSTTTTTAPPTIPPRARSIEILNADELVEPGESWNKLDEFFFVWNVAGDDVLNVRNAPGVGSDIVATIGPGSGDLRLFDVVENVGNSTWSPIEVTEGGLAGWVSTRFLRPQPPEGSPVVQGAPTAEELAVVVETLLSLEDPVTLAQLVGSEGLTISPFAYVGPDTVTLTADQVAKAADEQYQWGYTTGKGDPIISTLRQYLAGLAGRSALTSTTDIGYGVRIGGGNSIDNLDEVFPNATIVEYHHPGTSFYGGIDWSSLRFVFDTDPASSDSSQLVLRALVSDQWEI